MGDVVEAGAVPGKVPLEPVYLRDHLTPEMKQGYMERLTAAQDRAREASRTMKSIYRVPKP
jgi:hypothetical protein